MVKYWTAQKQYLFTELYRNGELIKIKLDKVLLNKNKYKSSTNPQNDFVYPGHSIFVYRGEDDSDEYKELCLVSWRTVSKVFTKTADIELKVVCYSVKTK